MSDGQLERIQGDLAVMRQALGLHLPFGKGMVALGIVLAVTALGAAAVSLVGENPWLQVTPFAACMALCMVGLYRHSRRTADLSPEVKLQVSLSITVYFAVIGAASGYALAAVCGPTIGVTRTAALYASSLAFVVAFSFILVLNAVRNRGRHYCLGLAAGLLLTGLLLPILDPRYCFPLAHGFMALGYLAGAAIQWSQLREPETRHAAD